MSLRQPPKPELMRPPRQPEGRRAGSAGVTKLKHSGPVATERGEEEHKRMKDWRRRMHQRQRGRSTLLPPRSVCRQRRESPTFPASSHVTSKGRKTPEFRIFTPDAGAPKVSPYSADRAPCCGLMAGCCGAEWQQRVCGLMGMRFPHGSSRLHFSDRQPSAVTRNLL